MPADRLILRVFEEALPRPILFEPLRKDRAQGSCPPRPASWSIRRSAEVSRFTVAAAAPAARRVR